VTRSTTKGFFNRTTKYTTKDSTTFKATIETVTTAAISNSTITTVIKDISTTISPYSSSSNENASSGFQSSLNGALIYVIRMYMYLSTVVIFFSNSKHMNVCFVSR